MPRVAVPRVLVLDDDEGLLRKLAAWIAAAGYDVVTFAAPSAAREHLQRAQAHIVLVDLQMPDVTPRDVIPSLAAAAPRARMIAMAAFPSVEQVTEAMRHGTRDLLEKPIQQSALLAALERQAHDLGLIARTEAELSALIGERLRVLRAAADKSQSEVAAEAGISSAQLSQIESGKSATSLWTLARLCAALDETLVRLFQETPS